MTSDATTDAAPDPRSTAPQSPFSTREVLIGTAVWLAGIAVVVGIPLVAAL